MSNSVKLVSFKHGTLERCGMLYETSNSTSLYAFNSLNTFDKLEFFIVNMGQSGTGSRMPISSQPTPYVYKWLVEARTNISIEETQKSSAFRFGLAQILENTTDVATERENMVVSLVFGCITKCAADL